MRRRILAAAVVGLAVMTGAPARTQAQATSTWLHVRVDERHGQSKVSVNLPVSVVDAALEAAPENVLREGRIHLGHGRDDISVSDLRRAWTELKKTGDAEFVSVEDDAQKVRVARAGDLLLIHVEKPSGREAVRVEVPIEVVDALFSGQGSELDVRAAFAKLRTRRGDIVRVNDEDATVRVWIDEGK